MKKQIGLYNSLPKFLACCMACFITSIFVAETKVWADDYEEVSYEDLVHQINRRRSQVSESTSSNMLDDITLHAGVSLLTSTLQISEAGKIDNLQMNGFQISFGIDLFSPNWVAEGAIRNFGTGSAGIVNYSFRELDMKVVYRVPAAIGEMGFRAGAGLATQYLNLTDGAYAVNESTPASIIFGGLEGKLSRNFALGGELGYRSALVNTAANRNSLDLSLRLDAFF